MKKLHAFYLLVTNCPYYQHGSSTTPTAGVWRAPQYRNILYTHTQDLTFLEMDNHVTVIKFCYVKFSHSSSWLTCYTMS